MTHEVIREVEDDPREGVAVTIEEDSETVFIPPPCAGCLGEATKHLPSAGVDWIEFPYCDACVPPRPRDAAREERADAWRLFARLLFGGGAGGVVDAVRGPWGNAVKLLLGPSGTVRLAFKNREYARLFVQANGAEMPRDR